MVTEIEIDADNIDDLIIQLKNGLGGILENKWNETILKINNKIAFGSIRFIPFDWGVNLFDFNLKFHEEVVLKIKSSLNYNPLRFFYVSQGSFKHRFENKKIEKEVKEFESFIFTNKDESHNFIHFPKIEQLKINVIQIVRKKFLKKKTTNVHSLNSKLHEVFVDTDHENRFASFGSLNLKMADLIKKLNNVKGKGMLRILKIEAKVYDILSLHIQQHNQLLKGVKIPDLISKKELKIIRKIAAKIVMKPSKNYTLDEISLNFGLTQAKLQNGFKFLYDKTVTEYIRNIRLETSRELLKTSDLNISQIVYTIGFSSRSYFSKIFKEKYGISPNQFKRKQKKTVEKAFLVAI